jgi:hypothetical protein
VPGFVALTEMSCCSQHDRSFNCFPLILAQDVILVSSVLA